MSTNIGGRRTVSDDIKASAEIVKDKRTFQERFNDKMEQENVIRKKEGLPEKKWDKRSFEEQMESVKAKEAAKTDVTPKSNAPQAKSSQPTTKLVQEPAKNTAMVSASATQKSVSAQPAPASVEPTSPKLGRP